MEPTPASIPPFGVWWTAIRSVLCATAAAALLVFAFFFAPELLKVLGQEKYLPLVGAACGLLAAWLLQYVSWLQRYAAVFLERVPGGKILRDWATARKNSRDAVKKISRMLEFYDIDFRADEIKQIVNKIFPGADSVERYAEALAAKKLEDVEATMKKALELSASDPGKLVKIVYFYAVPIAELSIDGNAMAILEKELEGEDDPQKRVRRCQEEVRGACRRLSRVLAVLYRERGDPEGVGLGSLDDTTLRDLAEVLLRSSLLPRTFTRRPDDVDRIHGRLKLLRNKFKFEIFRLELIDQLYKNRSMIDSVADVADFFGIGALPAQEKATLAKDFLACNLERRHIELCAEREAQQKYANRRDDLEAELLAASSAAELVDIVERFSISRLDARRRGELETQLDKASPEERVALSTAKVDETFGDMKPDELREALIVLYEHGATLPQEDRNLEALARVLVQSGRLTGFGSADRGILHKYLAKQEPAFVFKDFRRELHEELERLLNVVRGMNHLLERCKIEPLSEERVIETVKNLLAQGTPSASIAECADAVARQRAISSEMLLLLYDELTDVAIPTAAWPPSDAGTRPELASALISGRFLPREIEKSDVALILAILEELQVFDLERLRSDLAKDLADCRSVVDELSRALEYYGVDPLDEVRRREVTKKILRKGERKTSCAREMEADRGWPPDTLLVLDAARGGVVSPPLWRREDSDFLQTIAEALIKSGRLNTRGLQPSRLVPLLAQLPVFHFDAFRTDLEHLQELSKSVGDYAAFLARHGLRQEKLDLAEVIKVVTAERTIGDAELLDVLLKIGETSIRSIDPTMADEEVQGYCLLSLILHLTRSSAHEGIQEEACRKLAATHDHAVGEITMPVGVLIAWTYLDLKYEHRCGRWSTDSPFLRLDEFIPACHRQLEKCGERPEEWSSELETIRGHFEDGAWLTSKEALIKAGEASRDTAQIISRALKFYGIDFQAPPDADSVESCVAMLAAKKFDDLEAGLHEALAGNASGHEALAKIVDEHTVCFARLSLDTQARNTLEKDLAAEADSQRRVERCEAEVRRAFARLEQVLPILCIEREKPKGVALEELEDATLRDLAEVLLRSSRLPSDFTPLPEDRDRIRRLLKQLPTRFKITRFNRELEEQLYKNRSIVRRVGDVVCFYGIGALKDPEKTTLVKDLLSTYPEHRVEHCMKEVLSNAELGEGFGDLEQQDIVSALVVLYEHEASLPREPRILAALAQILASSGRLTDFGPADRAIIHERLAAQGLMFRFENFKRALDEELWTLLPVVDELSRTVELYGKKPPGEARRKELAKQLLRSKREHRKNACASAMAGDLGLPARALLVLDAARGGVVEPPLWRPEDRELRLALARVLTSSGRLHTGDLQPSDVALLLGQLPTFCFDALIANLEQLHGLRKSLGDYAAFLVRHGLRQDSPGLDEVIRIAAAAPRAEDGGTGLHDTLLNMGEASIRSWASSAMRDKEVEVFGLLSLILHLSRSSAHEEVRREACKKLAATRGHAVGEIAVPIGVLIAWAYLEVKNDLRCGHWVTEYSFLRLDELIPIWRESVTVRMERPSGFATELATLREQLDKGRWLSSKEDLMRIAFGLPEPKTDDIPIAPPPGEDAKPVPPAPPAPPAQPAQPAMLGQQIPCSKATLKRLFLRLDLEMIERFMETRTIIPYVLTVRARSGPVQGLLNRVAALYKDLYNYIPYTHFTRIGVVPRGMSFRTFCGKFKEDFQNAVEIQETILGEPPEHRVEKYEILLHAFSPTGRNPFDFGEPAGERLAMQRIKSLFAEQLSWADLYHVLCYSGVYEKAKAVDLQSVLLHASLPDVTDHFEAATREERFILDDEDGQIWQDFLWQLGGEKKVPAALRRGSDDWINAIDILAPIIASYLHVLKPRAYLEKVLDEDVCKQFEGRIYQKTHVQDLDEAIQCDGQQVSEALAEALEARIPSASGEASRDLAGAFARHMHELIKKRERVRKLAQAYLERVLDERIKHDFLRVLGIPQGNDQALAKLVFQADSRAVEELARTIHSYEDRRPEADCFKSAQAYLKDVRTWAKALRTCGWTIGHAELASCGP